MMKSSSWSSPGRTAIKTKEEATDLGEKTAEDKLSLTVIKNDFAQMRIIGQFSKIEALRTDESLILHHSFSLQALKIELLIRGVLETAEDKLSLTVSKNDFAQMRIIGQFNLGFIIAVRPGV
jgi:DNA mismatch repair ATPase MutL